MTIQAIWNNQILAESDQTIEIEDHHYFPPNSVNMEFLEESDFHTTCPWKGKASYYHVVVDSEQNLNAAWYYLQPLKSAIDIVGQDFGNYIAFWNGVEVIEKRD